MKKALLSVLAIGALVAVARPSNAQTLVWSQPFVPITMLYYSNWNTTTARLYIELANISDICGAKTPWAFYDPTEPNSSEIYKMLEAAFLSGRLVSLQLQQNPSSCEIVSLQVQR